MTASHKVFDLSCSGSRWQEVKQLSCARIHYFSTCSHVGWNQIPAFERREFQLESANPILINFDRTESRQKLKKETLN